ncbi:polymorphic toxin-type HINT domain-containing protein [Streptomyces sp. NPDC090994]|uniref:polymorphic toxin-type HINT domain-containing protein n=1 Tax=Streptomyces sp. NPDC090994 TaxID=3365969 RepID=UPI0037F23AEF
MTWSRGDLWACGSLFIQAIPWTKLTKIPSVIKAASRIASAVNAWMKAKEKARKIIEMAKKARELARKAKEAKRKAAERAAQLRKKAKEAATRKAKAAARKTGNAVQKTQKAAAKKAEPKPRQARAKDESSGKTQESSESSGESSGEGIGCKTPNSFVPGTLVLMADGTTKPIEDIENGDKVLATDPETGETAVETVTAEILGKGVKHLVKVEITTPDGTTAEVTATDGHPFWVPELGDWIDATDLKTGQWLRTSAGTYVQITAIERWTAQRATVHNLTVSDLHTYYVLAGESAVLVHNCGATQVEYGGDNLSRVAIQARKDNGWLSGGRNVAVVAYENGEGAMDYIVRRSSGRHSERLAIEAWSALGLDDDSLKGIYTELEPCGSDYQNCSAWLGKNAPGGVPVTYSFSYGPDRAGRRSGMNALKRGLTAIRRGLL